MRVLVVGAGLAGITSAYFLSKKGHDVVLLERDSRYGGQLRTLSYEDEHNETYFFDLGPHIPPNDVLWNELCKNLKSVTVSFPVKSSIKLPNLDLAFPFRLGQYNLTQLARLPRYAPSFIYSKLRKKGETNLEDSLINAYGNSFYVDCLRSYVLNFWKASPESISKDFSLRVRPPKMRELVRSLSCKIINKANTHYPLIYPRYGIEGALTPLIEEMNKMGVQMQINSTVKNIVHRGGRLFIDIEDPMGRSKFLFDKVVWAASILGLIRLLNLPQYAELSYRGLLVLNYVVFKDELLKEDVIDSYIMIPNILFHRVYEPKKVSRFMAPRTTTSACLEITLDKLKQEQIPSLIHESTKQFCRTFSLPKSRIKFLGYHVMENAYPFLFAGYRQCLDRLEENLKNQSKNIHLIGKTAQYHYWGIAETLNSAKSVCDLIN